MSSHWILRSCFIVVLLQFVQGWHIPDPNHVGINVSLVRGFLVCHCSPSGTGFTEKTRKYIQSSVVQLNEKHKALMEVDYHNHTSARVKLRSEAVTILNNCSRLYGYQSCINADMHQRSIGTLSLCTFDNTTHLNIARKNNGTWVTTGACPYREFDPNPIEVYDYTPGYLWCWCSSQSNTPQQVVINMMRSILLGLRTMNTSDAVTLSRARERMGFCSRRYSFAKCVDADKYLRGQLHPGGPHNESKSICKYDPVSTRNVGPDFLGNNTGYVTLGPCRDYNDTFVFPAVAQDMGTSAVTTSNGFSAFAAKVKEGCVHVKHLKGAVLQHSRHLLRDVLCYGEFCATPNHGIYFRGMYTSLKQLCAERTTGCIESKAMVNNLKWASNRRFLVDSVFVITPYNVLFPWPLIVLVQMLEDAFNILLSSSILGVVVSIAAFFFNACVQSSYTSSSPTPK